METETRKGTTTLRSRFQIGAVLALVLGMLAMPALASAQDSSPSDEQYSVIPPSSTAGDPGDPGTGLSGRVGSLPFTGLDVIVLSAVALGIAALGLGLGRAISARPQE